MNLRNVVFALIFCVWGAWACLGGALVWAAACSSWLAGLVVGFGVVPLSLLALIGLVTIYREKHL